MTVYVLVAFILLGQGSGSITPLYSDEFLNEKQCTDAIKKHQSSVESGPRIAKAYCYAKTVETRR